MQVISDLGEPVVLKELSRSSRIQMQDKLSRGSVLVDVRTWRRWSLDQEWHPTKKALLMEKTIWLEILPKLTEFLNKP